MHQSTTVLSHFCERLVGLLLANKAHTAVLCIEDLSKGNYSRLDQDFLGAREVEYIFSLNEDESSEDIQYGLRSPLFVRCQQIFNLMKATTTIMKQRETEVHT